MIPGAAPPHVCLFGAAPDTGNLGVSALGVATLGGLGPRLPAARFTVFDFGRGVRKASARAGGDEVHFELCGAMLTRRHYRPESLWTIRAANWLGGLGNPAVARIRRADAVLDISGGDSFTDLYGLWRFESVRLPKQIALEMDRPLILLPQTYGPFRAATTRRAAARIVQRAAMAWARDARSFDVLRELAGDAFDPQRHRCGVDVAFGLESRAPQPAALGALAARLAQPRAQPLIGLNVSGLIYHDPAAARQRYGFRADYRDLLHAFVLRLLHETDSHVLLTPHVLTPPGHYESDAGASAALRAALPDSLRGRVFEAPLGLDCCETKWLIGRTDWFCGTRMHATIAALSSGVPTAAIAYSSKTSGVFECCRQGECVVDPRALDTQEACEALWACFQRRENARRRLADVLPQVRAQVVQQMDAIAACVNATADQSLTGSGR